MVRIGVVSRRASRRDRAAYPKGRTINHYDTEVVTGSPVMWYLLLTPEAFCGLELKTRRLVVCSPTV